MHQSDGGAGPSSPRHYSADSVEHALRGANGTCTGEPGRARPLGAQQLNEKHVTPRRSKSCTKRVFIGIESTQNVMSARAVAHSCSTDLRPAAYILRCDSPAARQATGARRVEAQGTPSLERGVKVYTRSSAAVLLTRRAAASAGAHSRGAAQLAKTMA